MAVILPDLIKETLIPSLSLVETALLLFILTVVFANFFVVRRIPTVALAWVAVLLLYPYAGFALYLLFGRHIYSKRRFRLKVRDDQRVRVRRQALDLEHGTELTFERYVARGRIIRAKESISRLLTPLLKKAWSGEHRADCTRAGAALEFA